MLECLFALLTAITKKEQLWALLVCDNEKPFPDNYDILTDQVLVWVISGIMWHTWFLEGDLCVWP